MSYLKTETRHCETLGRDFEIAELSAAGQIELDECLAAAGEKRTRRHNTELAAITVKHCVTEFAGQSTIEVLAALPWAAVLELASLAADVSGIGEESDEQIKKNCEPTPIAGSCGAPR